MKIIKYFVVLSVVFLWSCEKIITPTFNSLIYFAPTDTDEWETISAESLGWDTTAIPDLDTFLEDSDTRAFMILKDGKMVLEKYWGTNFQNTGPFTQDSRWYWASAGKTLTASLIGIAQGEGLLNVLDRSSDHLGTGWTSLELEKENLVSLRNQLTMTTGFSNAVDLNCVTPKCFKYKVDAGNQWFYHTGTYTVLKNVIENVSGVSYNDYTDSRLEAVTGMNGEWIPLDDNIVYWSTARDAARFGVFLLAEGTWGGNRLLSGFYFNEMTTTSQSINESYGYLTWLNGKSSIVPPGLETVTLRPLSENAPDDTFAALGANGQIISVVPSENIVVVRFGSEPDNGLVPLNYFDDLWEKVNAIIEQ
ncbi:serine hydrolase domain-containing protein [Tenacibaculum agarivorans]|uniref:serine hydrolase domain-containing protein n=1 Tax=Tenacibaculum agarivorans TaxID=1908389 RepID=UPI00094BBC6A|nr:serine hydrolase [Tenacibaculum agarivorans]